MRVAIALIALSLTAAHSAPQQFRSGVEVVTVDALVTQSGKAVSGLTADDFELRDNGIVQAIDSVAVDDAPVSLLLALDTSNSVEGPALSHLKQAATAALDSLTPADRAALVTFAGAVTLRADWSMPSSSAREALASASAGGTTSLYDAIFSALTWKDPAPATRSFVLLFSDGADTSSWLPARAALERARRSDAVVYVVTRRPPRPDVRLEYRSGVQLWTERGSGQDAAALLELTAITGGEAFIAQRASDLREAFAAIVTQFRSRYLLRYRPAGVATSGWHVIDLRLKRGKAAIKARRGYAR